MLTRWMISALMLSLISGCATKESSCAWVKPIYPSRADVLTRGTKEQIVVHNETWEKNSE